MATLVRVQKPASRVQQASARDWQAALEAPVPSPFPAEFLRGERDQQELLDDLAGEELEFDGIAEQRALEGQTIDGHADGFEEQPHPHVVENTDTSELVPSLAYVQQSCLMTLNNLLQGLKFSGPEWQPIVPTRRHSMPSRPETSSNPFVQAESSSSALQTLVSNLRKSDDDQFLEASSTTTDDAVLLNELRRRVESLSSELTISDACLAQALISLLSHVNRLSTLDPKLFGIRSADGESVIGNHSSADLYQLLSRQVMDLQTKRLDLDRDALNQISSPVRKVEIALLWSKIDEELEAVLDICRQRDEVPRPYSPEQLPPGYSDAYDSKSLQLPPEYDQASLHSIEKSPIQQNSLPSSLRGGSMGEKMRMDLEAVTMAIDRLYLVAPQLANQRVELKKGKVEELERARLAGAATSAASRRLVGAKGKEKDPQELEKMFDLIGKASSRRLVDQSVVLDGDMKSRVEKARQRDVAKREAFVDHLISHSRSGRMHSQDAVFTPPELRNSDDVLLSFPEFIREQLPERIRLQQEQDPEVMLTLPEFVKEPLPQAHDASQAPVPEPTVTKSHAKRPSLTKSSSRSRSLSAPPLAWLLPSLSRSASPTPPRSTQTTQPAASNLSKPLTVRYVAEHHENLQHVLVFVGVDEGLVAGVDLEAIVPPSLGFHSSGDTLVLKCGSSSSAPLNLPVRVAAGKKEVRVQIGHYEIKLTTANLDDDTPHHQSTLAPSALDDSSSRLLDAEHLAKLSPTTFICSCCSLALIQPPPVGGLQYRDLPSEHWAELLDAWMCHSDQKLHEHIARHSNALWPAPGQALLGGSYILFEESSVVSSNTRVLNTNSKDFDEWQRVQCICGAVVGRCQRHSSDNEGHSAVTYRMAKYALRPVSATAEPLRIPFSAFILEDMMEFVHAHATYRFLILDEEEGKPRLLVWLFKPHIRLSYATTAQFALPRTGSIEAAKVLFRILGPDSSNADLKTVLDKHPGFPQAERLLYPLNICRRLAALLKESNTSYPFGMRHMTGLLVGWLRRS